VRRADTTSGSECNPAVHLVEVDPDVRTDLGRLLRSAGYEVRQFGDAQEFEASGMAVSPGCLVLEVRLPGGISGLDLQAQLLTSGVRMPVILMTGHGDIQMSVRAMKAGAVDFLVKPFREQDLLDAVASAMAIDFADRARRSQMRDLRERFHTLTPREREVMMMVAQGRMNKQIALHLSIAEITVKIHRGNAMRKMRARTAADLVRMAETITTQADAFLARLVPWKRDGNVPSQRASLVGDR
jgi:FixJ family two-component response regulator